MILSKLALILHAKQYTKGRRGSGKMDTETEMRIERVKDAMHSRLLVVRVVLGQACHQVCFLSVFWKAS